VTARRQRTRTQKAEALLKKHNGEVRIDNVLFVPVNSPRRNSDGTFEGVLMQAPWGHCLTSTTTDWDQGPYHRGHPFGYEIIVPYRRMTDNPPKLWGQPVHYREICSPEDPEVRWFCMQRLFSIERDMPDSFDAKQKRRVFDACDEFVQMYLSLDKEREERQLEQRAKRAGFDSVEDYAKNLEEQIEARKYLKQASKQVKLYFKLKKELSAFESHQARIMSGDTSHVLNREMLRTLSNAISKLTQVNRVLGRFRNDVPDPEVYRLQKTLGSLVRSK